MSARASTQDTLIGASLGLTILPFVLFALASIFLLIGGRLNPPACGAIALLASLCAVGLTLRVGGWRAVALVLAVFFLAAGLAYVIVDTSYDGQYYHYEAMRALADGWNPLREPYAPPESIRAVTPPRLAWAQHYPQADWLASVVLWQSGLGLEAAKLVHVLWAAALFLGALGAALSFGLSHVRAWALAFLVAGNPIIILQLFSRMNDGQLAAGIGLLVLFAVLWQRRGEAVFAVAAFAAMAYALNLKFSAIPLLVMVCAGLVLAAWLIAGRRQAIRAGIGLFTAGVVSIAVLGAHPYLTNTLNHHHPFYPVMGEGAIDIITNNRPEGFNEISSLERLAQSYLGPTSSSFDDAPDYKLPLTILRTELRAAGAVESRLGGFGPLFGGALLLALGLGVWFAWRGVRWQRMAVAGIAGVALLSLLMPEAWWARYVPQVWWLPVSIAMLALFSVGARVRDVGWVLALVLGFNIAFVTASSALYVGERALAVHRQIGALARAREPVCAFLGVSRARLELLHAAGVDVRLQREPVLTAAAEPLASAWPLTPPLPNIGPCAETRATPR
jgi:hypothetical protein